MHTKVLAALTFALFAVASPRPADVISDNTKRQGQALAYRRAPYDIQIAAYNDLAVWKPGLPSGWYYSGPVATSDQVSDNSGLILHANDGSALADVIEWKPVANLGAVSTWRAVAPGGYVVAGDFLVEGPDMPTPEQTAGIKAIRLDLVQQFYSQRQVWSGSTPEGVMSLWDVVAIPLVFISPGAFRSSDSQGLPSEPAVLLRSF